VESQPFKSIPVFSCIPFLFRASRAKREFPVPFLALAGTVSGTEPDIEANLHVLSPEGKYPSSGRKQTYLVEKV
jgi:hypothetical protein